MAETEDPAGAEEVRARLGEFIEEAFALRFQLGEWPANAAPAEVLARLLDIRSRLDRVDELLFRAVRIKSEVGRVHTRAHVAAEAAWDQASVATRRAPAVRGSGEFTGPRERYAEANLATLGQRRSSRQAEEVKSFADEAVEVLRIAQRGLDGARQETLQMLRSLQFESNLER